uniref:Uncharacterized protein n=1 Tax=Anguilla anguilla TaxID=7936 RepID=A0A0E9RHY6_ANGAN
MSSLVVSLKKKICVPFYCSFSQRSFFRLLFVSPMVNLYVNVCTEYKE